jgi:hypothetical protein
MIIETQYELHGTLATQLQILRQEHPSECGAFTVARWIPRHRRYNRSKTISVVMGRHEGLEQRLYVLCDGLRECSPATF